MELSGHGVMASVRRFGAPRQSTVGGHLRKEHLYKEQNRNKLGGGRGPQEFQGRMDAVFAAHLDLGVEAHHIGGDLPMGATGRAGSKNIAHVKNIGFGDDRSLRLGHGLGLHVGPAGKDDHHDQGHHSWQGQKPGMQGRSMHRGQGLSHVLMAQNSFHDHNIHQIHAAPETLAPLEGHHSLPSNQDAQHREKWVATASKGGPVAHSDNPLLGDDHLRILLGDVNSELMMRVQRASAALDKLWDLVDTDNDGMVNYYDTKNIFAKWSNTLSLEADKHINDEEKSSESKITYKRFIDIFLPIALTVSPDLIFAHLSNRFTAATQKRNPNLVPDDQKRALSGRKSMTGHGLENLMGMTNQPQGNQPRVGQSLAILQRQKSMQGQQNPEFSVDGHKRSSVERNKGQASSIDKINAIKRGSTARAAMDPRRQTMGTGVNRANTTDLGGPSAEPGPDSRSKSVFTVKSAARSQSVAIPQKTNLRGSVT